MAEIKLKMARAYPEQIETMRQWFHDLEEMLDDERKDVLDIGKFIHDTFESRRIDEYERILFGYETMFDNACDPSLGYLEFKPEIKAALSDAAQQQNATNETLPQACECGETKLTVLGLCASCGTPRR